MRILNSTSDPCDAQGQKSSVYLIVWSSSARVCLACLLPLFFCFRCWLFQVLHSHLSSLLGFDCESCFPLLRLPCCKLIGVLHWLVHKSVLFSQICALISVAFYRTAVHTVAVMAFSCPWPCVADSQQQPPQANSQNTSFAQALCKIQQNWQHKLTGSSHQGRQTMHQNWSRGVRKGYQRLSEKPTRLFGVEQRL